MAYITDEKIDEVADRLWREVYERPFRGKDRGRFAVTRDQLKQALDVERLHDSTVKKLQDVALKKGLIIIDLDDLFPCIETKVVRQYRRPPKALWEDLFGPTSSEEDDGEAEDSE